MILNKTFQPLDYEELENEISYIHKSLDWLCGHYALDNFHRRWEYAMAMRAMAEIAPDTRSIVDIGSGGSPFPAIMARAGYNVASIDKTGERQVRSKWPAAIRPNLRWIKLSDEMEPLSFDFVTSISVIEHTENDLQRLLEWWGMADYGMFITFDCSMDGAKKIDQHLRSYTMQQMRDMVESLPGGAIFGEVDMTYHGDSVSEHGTFGCFTVVRCDK
jgi:2-polyprenyl-3-methyl-5-hydroxy-6-metoxy-1,4-benzoquinol methylase